LASVALFFLGIQSARAETIDIKDVNYGSPRTWEQVVVDGEQRAIVLENVQHVRVAACAIHEVKGAAIIIRRSQDVIIENCSINGANSSPAGDAASVVIEDSSAIQLVNLDLSDTFAGHGVLIERSRDVTIIGGVIRHGLNDGLVIDGGQDIRLNGLLIERQWGRGVVIHGQPSGVEIRDLTIREAGGDGIALFDVASRALLYNSTLQNNGGYGLKLAWGVRELDVTANVFLHNGRGGVFLAGSCANRFERNTMVAPGRPGWTISLASTVDPASAEASAAGCQVNGNHWSHSDISAAQAVVLTDQADSAASLAADNTFTGERFMKLTVPPNRRPGAVLGVTAEVREDGSRRAMIMASLSAIALLVGTYLLVSAWRTVRRAAPAAAQLYYGHRRQWPTRPIIHLFTQWHQRHERR